MWVGLGASMGKRWAPLAFMAIQARAQPRAVVFVCVCVFEFRCRGFELFVLLLLGDAEFAAVRIDTWLSAAQRLPARVPQKQFKTCIAVGGCYI